MNKTIITEAVETDVPFLAALYDQIRREEFPWEKEVTMEDFARDTKGEKILVAKMEGRILGFLSIWEETRFIHCLFVAKDDRGLGIGEALVKEAEGRYGLPLTLKCMEENTKALAFYKHTGWIENTRRDGYCVMKRDK